MNFFKKNKNFILATILIPTLGLAKPKSSPEPPRQIQQSQSSRQVAPPEAPLPPKIIEISKIQYSNLVLIYNNNKNN